MGAVLSIRESGHSFLSPLGLIANLKEGMKKKSTPLIYKHNNESHNMANKLHTGEKVVKSGIYQISGTKNEIILSKGDKVPPSGKKAADVVLIRPVRHQK